MTAEQFIRQKHMEMAESQNKKNLIKLVDYSKEAEIAESYLNSQRDTIFKEELEKRLPSAKEIDNNAPCNPDASKEDVMAHNWFIGGAEWLIQYLRK